MLRPALSQLTRTSVPALAMIAAASLLTPPDLSAQRPGGEVRPVTTYPGGSKVTDEEKKVIPGGECTGGAIEIPLRELTEWDVDAIAVVPYAVSQGQIKDSIDVVAPDIDEAVGGNYSGDLTPVLKVLDGRWEEGMMLWFAKFSRVQVDRLQIWTCPEKVWVLSDVQETSTTLTTGWIETHRAQFSSTTGPLLKTTLEEYARKSLPQDDSPYPTG